MFGFEMGSTTVPCKCRIVRAAQEYDTTWTAAYGAS